MLNMSAIGNRNSTPVESNSTSSLRPPSSRAIGANHHLRASADMANFTSPSSNRIRPSSDFYGTQQGQGQGTTENDASDKIAQQWIADIDQYETTLEEMAAATLDQDFKDELSAIEQWFRVLSEAERTAVCSPPADNPSSNPLLHSSSPANGKESSNVRRPFPFQF